MRRFIRNPALVLVWLLAASVSSGTGHSGAASPKVLIFYDMEGVSGISRPSQAYSDMMAALGYAPPPKTRLANTDYHEGRRSLTADVNAAIRGLKQAGAGDIVVVDAHSSGNFEEPDILLDEMDSRASFDFRDKPFDMYLESPDSSYQAVVCIGMHPPTGARGFMAHTYSQMVGYRINGIEMTETTVLALLTARYGIPIIMVSGDDVLQDYVKSQLPNAEYAVVKKSRSRAEARPLPEAVVQASIETAARNALKKLPSFASYSVGKPYVFELSFQNPAAADLVYVLAALYPGLKRVDDLTVGFTIDDIAEGWKISKALRRMVLPQPERQRLLFGVIERRRDGGQIFAEFKRALFKDWFEPGAQAAPQIPAKKRYFGAN